MASMLGKEVDKAEKKKDIIKGYVTLGRTWVLWNHYLFGLGLGLF